MSSPLFESHADALTPELFERYTQKRLKFIASEVKRRLGDKAVPMSIFCKGAHFMNNYFLDSEDWLSMIKILMYEKRKRFIYTHMLIHENKPK